MRGFRVQVAHEGDEPVVRVRGELDAATAPALQASLAELVEAGVDRIVIDLTAVPFVDSCGIGALVALRRRARDHGTEVVLRHPVDRVMMVLELTGVAGKVFSVEGAEPSGIVPIRSAPI